MAVLERAAAVGGDLLVADAVIAVRSLARRRVEDIAVSHSSTLKTGSMEPAAKP
jgi:hypothetical protein